MAPLKNTREGQLTELMMAVIQTTINTMSIYKSRNIGNKIFLFYHGGLKSRHTL